MGSIPTGGTLIFFIFWPNQTTQGALHFQGFRFFARVGPTRAHTQRARLSGSIPRGGTADIIFLFWSNHTQGERSKGSVLCARVGPTRTHTARDSLWPRVLWAYPRLRCVASALKPGPGLMREQVCESLKKNLREYSRFTSDCLTLELGQHNKKRGDIGRHDQKS